MSPTKLKNSHLIYVCGVPGSGKTTYINKIYDQHKKNKNVIIVSIDKERSKKWIFSIGMAKLKIWYDLHIFFKKHKSEIIVIIETCHKINEKNMYNASVTSYGFDFTSLSIETIIPNLYDNLMLCEYYQWSLYNVLTRKYVGNDYNLNPEKWGYNECITIHFFSFRTMFEENLKSLFPNIDLYDDIFRLMSLFLSHNKQKPYIINNYTINNFTQINKLIESLKDSHNKYDLYLQNIDGGS